MRIKKFEWKVNETAKAIVIDNFLHSTIKIFDREMDVIEYREIGDGYEMKCEDKANRLKRSLMPDPSIGLRDSMKNILDFILSGTDFTSGIVADKTFAFSSKGTRWDMITDLAKAGGVYLIVRGDSIDLNKPTESIFYEVLKEFHRGEIINRVKVVYNGGIVIRENSESISKYGTREKVIHLRKESSREEAILKAESELKKGKFKVPAYKILLEKLIAPGTEIPNLGVIKKIEWKAPYFIAEVEQIDTTLLDEITDYQITQKEQERERIAFVYAHKLVKNFGIVGSAVDDSNASAQIAWKYVPQVGAPTKIAESSTFQMSWSEARLCASVKILSQAPSNSNIIISIRLYKCDDENKTNPEIVKGLYIDLLNWPGNMGSYVTVKSKEFYIRGDVSAKYFYYEIVSIIPSLVGGEPDIYFDNVFLEGLDLEPKPEIDQIIVEPFDPKEINGIVISICSLKVSDNTLTGIAASIKLEVIRNGSLVTLDSKDIPYTDFQSSDTFQPFTLTGEVKETDESGRVVVDLQTGCSCNKIIVDFITYVSHDEVFKPTNYRAIRPDISDSEGRLLSNMVSSSSEISKDGIIQQGVIGYGKFRVNVARPLGFYYEAEIKLGTVGSVVGDETAQSGQSIRALSTDLAAGSAAALFSAPNLENDIDFGGEFMVMASMKVSDNSSTSVIARLKWTYTRDATTYSVQRDIKASQFDNPNEWQVFAMKVGTQKNDSSVLFEVVFFGGIADLNVDWVRIFPIGRIHAGFIERQGLNDPDIFEPEVVQVQALSSDVGVKGDKINIRSDTLFESFATIDYELVYTAEAAAIEEVKNLIEKVSCVIRVGPAGGGGAPPEPDSVEFCVD